MANVQGVSIVIKAFLPTGKTLDEQFDALSKVKAAHASGDYAELLKAASIDEVKTEQKVRRIEDAPPAVTGQTEVSNDTTAADLGANIDDANNQTGTQAGETPSDEQPDAEVPAFLKKGKPKAA